MFKKKSGRFLSLFSLVLVLLMSSVVPSFASNTTTTMVGDSEIKLQIINDNNDSL